MVVEERDKILPGFAMRTDKPVFSFFTVVEDARELRNVSPTFHDVRNFEERRVVEGGIDTKPGLTMSSHEWFDDLIAIIHFTEGEEDPFPERMRNFSMRGAEN